jgi:hypothetical protein
VVSRVCPRCGEALEVPEAQAGGELTCCSCKRPRAPGELPADGTADRVEEVQVGRPTWEESELYDWALWAYRRNPERLRVALGLLAAAAVVLLAVALAALAWLEPCRPARALVLLPPVAAFALALWGVLPRTALVSPQEVDDVRQLRERILARLARCLWAAGVLLAAGLLALAVAALLG